jgi:probable HAF family extracellular repeat protein
LTEASGVNDSGQVVGDYRDATTGIFHGFLWDAGQFFTIDVPFSEASSTAASGINNIGQIVGHYFDENVGHDRGFLYNDGIFTSFDFPGAVVTIPFDINDNGQIVGLFVLGTGSDASSFILDDGTFTTLDVPFSGVLFTQLRGINNQGQIVGRYVQSNPDDPVNPFPSHGFVASPNVNAPLVASLTDSTKTNAVPQPAIDEGQNLATKREANGQLCFFDNTTPAAFAFALSEAGLCPTGMTMPTENP